MLAARAHTRSEAASWERDGLKPLDRRGRQTAAPQRADDRACQQMTVPGVGPIISSATVAAIGTGDVFGKGRDFIAYAAANHTKWFWGGVYGEER